MSRPIIRLSSVTYAIRAQKLLEQRGIKGHIKKLTRGLNSASCGYGLEIYGDLNQAVEIIRASGIRISDISQG